MNILSEKIIAANTLGKTNLIEKGVTLFEDATTYEIMQGIADVPSSGGGSSGIEYTSIVYNADDTITLTDTDGNEHIIVCEYDGDKLIGATYDGEAVELSYEGDALVGVDGASVDLSSANIVGLEPIDYTVKFLADGEPYEIVSIKSGNSVNAPINNPTSENGTFNGWQISGENVVFPFTPESDIEVNALFVKVRSEITLDTEGVWINSYCGAKLYNGLCIYGFARDVSTDNKGKLFGIAKSNEATMASYATSDNYVETFTYDGETWYARPMHGTYSHYPSEWKSDNVEYYDAGVFDENTYTKILDYYFGKV